MSESGQAKLAGRRRYRRIMKRANALMQDGDLDAAVEAFGRVIDELTAHGAAFGEDDLIVLRDMARAWHALAEAHRRREDFVEAVSAQRACCDVVAQLATRDPDRSRRQHNVTIAYAALSVTLERAGDLRLAVSAARLAAVQAEATAERFPDEPVLAFEALKQRLMVEKLMVAAASSRATRIANLRAGIAAAQLMAPHLLIADDVWNELRQGYLDLANLLQLEQDYAHARQVLDELMGLARIRHSQRPADIERCTQVAIVHFLRALIETMEERDSEALVAHLEALACYDHLPANLFLEAQVQSHRARFLAQALEQAASRGPAFARELRGAAIAPFVMLSEERACDAGRQQLVLVALHDFARQLIARNAPAMALDAIAAARQLIAVRRVWDEDALLLRRWEGFLNLETGRALAALNRTQEAGFALRESLDLNEALWSEDPNDVRAPCDIAYAQWQLARVAPAQRRDHLRRSRAILTWLSRSGRLPDYARAWLGAIERDLQAA
jgi:tetratricopeptide (TPR) repeat protein